MLFSGMLKLLFSGMLKMLFSHAFFFFFFFLMLKTEDALLWNVEDALLSCRFLGNVED